MRARTRKRSRAALLAVVFVAACSPATQQGSAPPGETTAGAPAEVLIPVPELSDAALRNQDGEAVRIDDLRGRPALLTFLYTRCPMPDMCPATMLRLKEVQEALTPEDRRAVRLIAVSFDPLDTPHVLAEYGELWEVDTSFWSLLTGDADQVQRVAGAYGAWYEKAEGEVYDHTMLTLILLPDGAVHRILTGSAWDSRGVAETLRSLATAGPNNP